MSIRIRPRAVADKPWGANLVKERWGDEIVVAHGTFYQRAELFGLVALQDEEVAGLVTYHIKGVPIRDEIKLEIAPLD